MREDIGLDYQPSQVVVASGAKHNVYIALQVLLDPGDECYPARALLGQLL